MVIVNITVPAVTSAALGVYTAANVVLFGAYVPVPPLQVIELAEPPFVPAKVTVEPPQTVWSIPAFAVLEGTVFVIITSSIDEVHVEFEIVHRNVALEPAANPVIVVVGELADVIVTVPDIKLQVPVPITGVLAAMANELFTH